MRRREFLGVLGAGAAWATVVHAQQSDRIRRVGVLMSGSETDPEQKARWDGFRESLEQLGWSDGRNVRLDVRFAGGPSEFERIAKEIVDSHPEVIFVQSTGFVATVTRQTKTIPIVFTNVSDPIGAGFVATLSRPGGNLTGFVLLESTIAGKWLAMLKEMVPRLKRVALIGNPKTAPYEFFLRAAQAAATSLDLQVAANRVENETDLESSFQAFARETDGGLVVIPDATMTRLRSKLIELAARYRLPAVYPERFYATGGGLMSYGIADLIEQFRQAASYVDRILKGERPAELPVQGPTKYSTILNFKTAKALGLTVPPSMLVAADEVIE
jgi:putative ABC transport system substrate-binding protein